MGSWFCRPSFQFHPPELALLFILFHTIEHIVNGKFLCTQLIYLSKKLFLFLQVQSFVVMKLKRISFLLYLHLNENFVYLKIYERASFGIKKCHEELRAVEYLCGENNEIVCFKIFLQAQLLSCAFLRLI